MGAKLREALKQQLAAIHERVEAKKLAKLALAEVRELLAKEEEEKELELGRKEIKARAKERAAARLKEEEEKLQQEEMERALERPNQKEGEKKWKTEEGGGGWCRRTRERRERSPKRREKGQAGDQTERFSDRVEEVSRLVV